MEAFKQNNANSKCQAEALLATAEDFINAGFPEKAFKIYKNIVIAEPNVTAQYKLGSLYAQGKGIEQSFLEGAYWFRKAEMGGDEWSGTLVSECELYYMNQYLKECSSKELYEMMSRFVMHVYPNEPSKALIKHKLTDLGMYYLNKRNYTNAAKLLRASAEFCNEKEAQYNLGMLYNTGTGEPQNDILAAYWFDRASRNGHKEALDERENIIDAYKAKLTLDEFEKFFGQLAQWCDKGTDDTPADFRAAVYWKMVSKEERRKLQIRLTVDNKDHVLEFKEKTVLAKSFGSKAPLEEFVYTIGTKRFKGKEPSSGDAVEVLTDNGGYYVAVKQDRFGDKTIYEYVSVPTFDSGDREWDSYRKNVLIYDGENIDVIAFKGGYKLSQIEVYKKLTVADESFKPYFDKLNYPADAYKDIRWV